MLSNIRQVSNFRMYCDSPIEQWRADTFETKEPETIAWVDSFEVPFRFIDIGANIGLYSLYCAAKYPGELVDAFEPDRRNVARLRENFHLNHFAGCHSWRVAIGDTVGLSTFPNSTSVGESGGQLGDGEESVIVITLDAFMMDAMRTYVKIDVDGQEWAIVQGMMKAIQKPNIESVLIEINDHAAEIDQAFTGAGFTVVNRFNTMSPHSNERRCREGIMCSNVVFTRE
jgi:FkbM family methyltransferase